MKKILTALMSGLLAISLVSCSANSGEEESTNKQSDKPKYETFAIGEAGISGHYQVKVDNVEEKTSIKTFQGETTTTNNFIVVNVQIAGNEQLVEFGYTLMDFILVDEEGKTYATADITNALNVTNKENPEYIGIYDTINPGVWKKTQIVFEVPKGITPKYIANKNEASSTYVQYELK